MTRTALYRLHDDQGELLYVGIAVDPQRRWHQHATSKAWWSEVAFKAVEWHPGRFEAENAEALAIRSERPKFNVRVPGVTNRLLYTLGLVDRGHIPPEEASGEIDRGIAEALGEGWSVEDVAFVTKLSRQRITQIRQQVRERRTTREGS